MTLSAHLQEIPQSNYTACKVSVHNSRQRKTEQRKKANGKLKQSNTPSCNPTHEMEGQVYAYQGPAEVFLCVGPLREEEVDHRQNQTVSAKGETYYGQNISNTRARVKIG